MSHQVNDQAKLTEKVSRRSVLIGSDESDAAEAVIEYLAMLRGVDAIYSRCGMLVHVVNKDESRDTGIDVFGPRIRELPKSLVRERITQCCRLKRERKNGGKFESRPEQWLVDSIFNRGEWKHIRPLTGIIECPSIRPDGSIIQKRGYDTATGLLYEPSCEFAAIPETPTKEDARAAAEALLDVVTDFPFFAIEDRLAWLCMVMTQMCRPAISGPCPMFVVSASVAGSGKSMLVDVSSLIARGQPAARKTYIDDKELGKTITAIAIEATPFVLLDNIDKCKPLGGSNLEACLTSTTWSGRILGMSATTGGMPMRAVWSATGNNISYRGDAHRRVLPIRLDSKLEKPETRTDFRHPDILGWVTQNRAALVRAALTIARAFVVAGCPDQGLRLGSYEKWCRLVPSAIAWLGLGDPTATRVSIDSTDESLEFTRVMIQGIAEATKNRKRPLTCSELLDEQNYSLRQAIQLIDNGVITAAKLGKEVCRIHGRVIDGQRIVRQFNRNKTSVYTVEFVSRAGDRGDAGAVFSHTGNEFS